MRVWTEEERVSLRPTTAISVDCSQRQQAKKGIRVIQGEIVETAVFASVSL
jgi:hypothetical protein